MDQASLTARDEWRAGWALVVASFAGFMFFSLLTPSMSVFMKPLVDEFGWSRTTVSAGVTMSAVVTAALSPFVGIFLDRYGSRRLALPGIVLTAMAMGAIGLANGSSAQWLALWACYALISITVKTTVWTAAVAGVFDKAQGMALGLTLAGATAAHTVVAPLCAWLIDQHGWRMAYVWLGLGPGAITFVLCWLFLFDAHDRAKAVAPAARPQFPGLTLEQAWRSSALWRIGVAIFVIMLLTIGLLIHQIEILSEAGVSRTNAAWLASLAGIMGVVGKLVTGALLDRFNGNIIGGVTLAAAALAFALLIGETASPGLIVFAMLVNGYAAGAKLQVASFLTIRHGGMRHFGKIYGMITALVSLGSGLGPLLAGIIYDRAGHYDTFLVLGAGGCVLAGVLVLSLPNYPDWKAVGAVA